MWDGSEPWQPKQESGQIKEILFSVDCVSVWRSPPRDTQLKRCGAPCTEFSCGSGPKA